MASGWSFANSNKITIALSKGRKKKKRKYNNNQEIKKLLQWPMGNSG